RSLLCRSGVLRRLLLPEPVRAVLHRPDLLRRLLLPEPEPLLGGAQVRQLRHVGIAGAAFLAMTCSSATRPGVGRSSHAIDTSSNQAGRLTASQSGYTRTAFEYDRLGRTTATEYVLETSVYELHSAFGYALPAAGAGAEVVSETFPDNEVVRYGYDSGGF